MYKGLPTTLAILVVGALFLGFTSLRLNWQAVGVGQCVSGEPPYPVDGNYKIFVISLKGTQRAAHIAKEIANHSATLQMQLFEAVRGTDVVFEDVNDTLKIATLDNRGIRVPYDLVAARNSKDRLAMLTLGEIGCAMSHLLLYHKCYLENLPAIVVLEDDTMMRFNGSYVRQILSHLPNPAYYDVAYVQKGKNAGHRGAFPGTDGYFYHGGEQFGAYGYVVTWRLCRYAYHHFVLSMPADDWLHWNEFKTITAADEYLFVESGMFDSDRNRVGTDIPFLTTASAKRTA